jgi:uncharacterized membrane protein YesL
MLSVSYFALVAILGVNAAFYLRADWIPFYVGVFLAGAMVWAQVILLLLVFYAGISLATRRATQTRPAIQEAALTILRAPLAAIGLGIGTVFVGALLALTQIGLPFVSMGFAATYAATGERRIRRRLDPQHETEHDGEEESRTLRDLLKPWEFGR